jgi:hypothetical protein
MYSHQCWCHQGNVFRLVFGARHGNVTDATCLIHLVATGVLGHRFFD